MVSTENSFINFMKLLTNIYVVGDILKKLISNPLPLMTKPSPTQIQTVETSTTQFKEEEENFDELPIDQVYCWWMEMPELKKTAICIQKTPNVKFTIYFLSELQVEIQSKAFLSDEEINEIGTVLGIPKEYVFHHWTSQHKDSVIRLNHAIMNSPSEVLKTNQLMVITFPMKDEKSIEF